jgi:hypothetical protein
VSDPQADTLQALAAGPLPDAVDAVLEWLGLPGSTLGDVVTQQVESLAG